MIHTLFWCVNCKAEREFELITSDHNNLHFRCCACKTVRVVEGKKHVHLHY
jgi:uncharacterized Zn finger protein